MISTKKLLFVFVCLILGLLLACEEDETTPTEVSANFATCEGCHNDEAVLKKIAPQDVEHAAGGG